MTRHPKSIRLLLLGAGAVTLAGALLAAETKDSGQKATAPAAAMASPAPAAAASPAPAAAPAAAAAPAPAAPAGAAPAAKPTGPATPEQMQGINFEGLSDAQKQMVISVLNENSCDCGCGMKVGVCRRDDPKCGRSLALANQVIALAKQGKSREDIVKIALSPPTKFVQFDLPVGDAPSVGPKNAKVTVLSYLDYQCPFCARVDPTLDEIMKTYPNDVRVVIKMHPLGMHPNAPIAAQAAVAAQAQGKFFEMHKKLFANQASLSRDNILAWAKDLGLDVEKFKKDLDSDAVKTRIQKESAEAEGIGASGTPASFVNGRYVTGAKPMTFWQ